ncbi:hypothetical protein B0H16DRAFT_1780976 [Mycena metata]|uniref:Uncharacterized protein n=1 Tax=Mycena metata TaxID=1033252 RepID=A0AAD7JRX4_9AGAR|nr:hypothetical protein B0H16DRAFT_1780976 [Mycena metata]
MPGLVLSNAKEFRGDLLGWGEQVLPDWLGKAAPKQEADLCKGKEDDDDEALPVVNRCPYPAEKKDKKDKKPVKKSKNDEPAGVIHDFALRLPKRGPAPPPPPAPAPTLPPPLPSPAPPVVLLTLASSVPSVDNNDVGGGEKASQRKKNKMDAASAKPDGEKDGDGRRAKRDGEKGGREAGDDEGLSKKRKKHGGSGSAQAGGDEGSPKKRKKDSDGASLMRRRTGAPMLRWRVMMDQQREGRGRTLQVSSLTVLRRVVTKDRLERLLVPKLMGKGQKRGEAKEAGYRPAEQSSSAPLATGIDCRKLPAPFKWTDKYEVSHVKRSLCLLGIGTGSAGQDRIGLHPMNLPLLQLLAADVRALYRAGYITQLVEILQPWVEFREW